MKEYHVWQAVLTDSMLKEINSGHNRLLSDVYFRLVSLDPENAQDRVNAATALGLYKCVGRIQANDLESAFDVGNGYPQRDDHRYEREHPWATSLSVGNVLFDTETETCHACCSLGWHEINLNRV
jgi:hypothetical protein